MDLPKMEINTEVWLMKTQGLIGRYSPLVRFGAFFTAWPMIKETLHFSPSPALETANGIQAMCPFLIPLATKEAGFPAAQP